MNESNEAQRQWLVREYRDGDEEQIRELRGIVLSGAQDSNWWQWMCRNGPDGPAIIWLADTGEEIIGHHALLPLRVKIGDQVCKCCIGFDAMTHPDYQRRGVLASVDAKLGEAAEEKGVNFSFGMATTRIFPVYTKLQALVVCVPPLLVRVVNWGRVLKYRFKVPVPVGNLFGYFRDRLLSRSSRLRDTGIAVEQIQSFDERFDDLWQKASEIAPIMIVRDRSYLNWRYVEKPENKYVMFAARRQREIVGYIVVMLVSFDLLRGEIIDLLTVPGEDIVTEELVNRAIGYLREEGAEVVTCLMLPDTPYYRTLRKMGFICRSSGLQLGVRLRKTNLSSEFITNPRNWYYVLGDRDTV
jgi:GNAT superfamily N-acetyltransferase